MIHMLPVLRPSRVMLVLSMVKLIGYYRALLLTLRVRDVRDPEYRFHVCVRAYGTDKGKPSHPSQITLPDLQAAEFLAVACVRLWITSIY